MTLDVHDALVAVGILKTLNATMQFITAGTVLTNYKSKQTIFMSLYLNAANEGGLRRANTII